MTPASPYEPVLEVTRGSQVESLHYGAVAVATADGRLWAWCGDPEASTFLRSAAKPFQAIPLVESGAADHYRLTDEELALVCASHTGTQAHLRTLASLHAKSGIDERELLCGVHPPMDAEAARRLRQAGTEPRPAHHNCSGKHSGMLALARFLGGGSEDYLAPTHPVQAAILEAFADLSGMKVEDVVLGVDGCSAPNFAVPLRAAAAAFARLADPGSRPGPRGEALRRIFRAMTAHPEMVSGPMTFDTRLMQAAGGRLLAKGGAEGYMGLAVPPQTALPGAGALGIAVKIADGDGARRARPPVVLEVLESLGIVSQAQLEELNEFGPRPLTNSRGLEVGEIRPHVRLRFEMSS